MKKLFAFLLASSLGFSYAAKLPDFRQIGQTKTGNSVSLGPGGNVGPSAPIYDSRIPIRQTNLGGGWEPAGNYGAAKSATTPANAQLLGSGEVIFPGTRYPFQAGYVVPPSLIVGAMSAFCSNPLVCVALTVGTPYLLEWLNQSGVRPSPTVPGTFEKKTPGNTVPPLSVFSQSEINGCNNQNVSPSAPGYVASCIAAAVTPNTICGYWAQPSQTCYALRKAENYTWAYALSSLAPAVLWEPASMSDISPYMDKPMDPRIFKELLDKGANIDLPLPTITGPNSVNGEEVTTNNSDGTKTVSKTTYNFQTSGNTVTNTSNSTTTTNYNIDNSVKNSSTTTTLTTPSKPPSEIEKEDYTFSDSEFPEIPKLYERKYPDGLVGVWDEKILAIKAAPLFTLVENLMPTNIGSSGSCPSFMIPVNFGQWGEYGNLDFSPPCMVWDFGKIIIIISALLLSRRLIFGG